MKEDSEQGENPIRYTAEAKLLTILFLPLVFLMVVASVSDTSSPPQPNSTERQPYTSTLDQNTWDDNTYTPPRFTSEPIPRRGQIDWAYVEWVRRSWQEGNFRSAVREEQVAAMLVILAGIDKAVPDALDREATKDYVQGNIDSW